MAAPAQAETLVFRARHSSWDGTDGRTLLRGNYAAARYPGGTPDLKTIEVNGVSVVHGVPPNTPNPRGISMNYSLAELQAKIDGPDWSYFQAAKNSILLYNLQLLATKRHPNHILLSPVKQMNKDEFDKALAIAETFFTPVNPKASAEPRRVSFPPPPDEQCIETRALLWASKQALSHQDVTRASELWDLAKEYHDNPIPDASFRYHFTLTDCRLVASVLTEFSRRFCLDQASGVLGDPYGAVDLLTEVDDIWTIHILLAIRNNPQACPWAAGLTCEALRTAITRASLPLSELLYTQAHGRCYMNVYSSVDDFVQRLQDSNRKVPLLAVNHPGSRQKPPTPSPPPPTDTEMTQ